MTNSNRERGGSEKPVVILIGTEGRETEPQYFNIVINQKRIRQRADVKVVGALGQHKQLIDEVVIQRALKAKSLDLKEEDVEAWAVCDKDTMTCTLTELQEYAQSKGVFLAFSSPSFEIFILQHFTRTSSNATARELKAKITVELNKIRMGLTYEKSNLSWLNDLVDSDPQVLERAIKNSSYLEDSASSPYLTTHHLLTRLLEMAS